MNESDKRSLKCYLTNVLEPDLKHATDGVAEWKAERELASDDELTYIAATNMLKYHQAKAQAYSYAIAEFKELFAEELGIVPTPPTVDQIIDPRD